MLDQALAFGVEERIGRDRLRVLGDQWLDIGELAKVGVGWHRRVADQDRNHVPLRGERQPHLLADAIDRMVLALVQQLDPPRPDHNEDHAGRCDFLFDDLRKLVAQVNALVVVKDLSVSQPGGQLFMDAHDRIGRIAASVRYEHAAHDGPRESRRPSSEGSHSCQSRPHAGVRAPAFVAVPTGDFDVVVPFVRRLPALARSTAPIIRSRDRPPKQRSGECVFAAIERPRISSCEIDR